MAKIILLPILISFSLTIFPAAVVAIDVDPNPSPTAVANFYQNLHNAKEKQTHLHFYLQDIVAGPNATNMAVVPPNNRSAATMFGLVAVIDDPLTPGPDIKSGIIGRAQGLLGGVGLEEISYQFTVDFVFTKGEFKGSSFCVGGRNPFMNKYREVPVVGGTGAFRLARGTATLETLTYDKKTGNAMVEYNVWILHYV